MKTAGNKSGIITNLIFFISKTCDLKKRVNDGSRSGRYQIKQHTINPTNGKSIVVVIDSVNNIIIKGINFFMGKGVGADRIKATFTGFGSCGVECISPPSIDIY